MSAERECGYSAIRSRARCSLSGVSRATSRSLPIAARRGPTRGRQRPRPSPVDVAEDGVDGRDDGDGVGDAARPGPCGAMACRLAKLAARMCIR